MRIVIDARMLYWPGVGRYSKALLDNFEDLDHTNEYVVLRRPEDRGLWEPTATNFKVVDVNINPYTLGEQSRLAGIVHQLNPDLVHFTTPNAPVMYRGKRIVTVHDLTLLDYDTSRGTGVSKVVKKLKRVPFHRILSENVRSAQALITPTEYVKSQLVRRFNVAAKRVHVTHLAADPSMAKPEPLDRFKIGGEYLLFVGAVYPYKNAGAIVEALKTLSPKYPQLKLVVTSRPGFFREELLGLAARLGVADRLVLTGYVSDGELVSLYQKAALYVYPSFSEGFGLEGLEAMAQGLPVLAARSSSLPEVCGDAAEYFDPYNTVELAEKIDALLSDDSRRRRLRQLGDVQYRRYSWHATAEQTLSLYKQLLKS
ncbi:MAG TPA: glycosyltransferase family 1 protein [Candidatus Saccharimonadia bacterium]|nr:glycosyltransferase family 1 protein [Candidatus Saccharimonadia bacterium]